MPFSDTISAKWSTHMARAGYAVNPSGMCYGIAFACLHYAANNALPQLLQMVEQLDTNGSSISSHELTALFDTILLYHGPYNQFLEASTAKLFSELYPDNKQNYSVANDLLNEPGQPGIHATSSSYQVFSSPDKIRTFLQQDRKGQNFYMTSWDVYSHMTAVMFYEGKWYFVDHDNTTMTPGERCTFSLCRTIFESLRGTGTPANVVCHIARYTKHKPATPATQQPYTGHDWLAHGRNGIRLLDLALDLSDDNTVYAFLTWLNQAPIREKVIINLLPDLLNAMLSTDADTMQAAFFSYLQNNPVASCFILEALIMRQDQDKENYLCEALHDTPHDTAVGFLDNIRDLQQNHRLRLSSKANHQLIVARHEIGCTATNSTRPALKTIQAHP